MSRESMTSRDHRTQPAIAAAAFAAATGVGYMLPALSYYSATLRTAFGVQTQTRDGRGYGLTFDDGPHPEGTAAVLEVLARFKTPATFFLVGEQVAPRARTRRRNRRRRPRHRAALRSTPQPAASGAARGRARHRACPGTDRRRHRMRGRALPAAVRDLQRSGPSDRTTRALAPLLWTHWAATGALAPPRVDRDDTARARCPRRVRAAAPRRGRLLGARVLAQDRRGPSARTRSACGERPCGHARRLS